MVLTEIKNRQKKTANIVIIVVNASGPLSLFLEYVRTRGPNLQFAKKVLRKFDMGVMKIRDS